MKKTIFFGIGIGLLLVTILIYMYMTNSPSYKINHDYDGKWDPNGAGVYTCPNNNSISKDYCIVPIDSAQKICNSNPKCIGYLTTTDPTRSFMANDAQLISSLPKIIGPTQSTFYQKS